MKAEAEIQRAAMASQRKSQADYEQALRDFQRTGTVGDIREISLRDDGVAGERYDAESQLTIRADEFGDAHAFTVATSRLPEALPASGGPAVIVRVAANTYREPGAAGDSGITSVSVLNKPGCISARSRRQSSRAGATTPRRYRWRGLLAPLAASWCRSAAMSSW